MSKHRGNLVKPKGKPKNTQSFLNKILELATASSTNLILKIDKNRKRENEYLPSRHEGFRRLQTRENE